jgi:hypothetical protein
MPMNMARKIQSVRYLFRKDSFFVTATPSANVFHSSFLIVLE